VCGDFFPASECAALIYFHFLLILFGPAFPARKISNHVQQLMRNWPVAFYLTPPGDPGHELRFCPRIQWLRR
jgi:hypothetical protein